MDWKTFYRAELASDDGRRWALEAIRRHRDAPPALARSVAAGAILSFPHTTLRASAEPIARTVAALHAVRPERVVALGVLHGGALPEPLRGLHEAYAGWLASGAPPGPLVDEIYAELSGVFFRRDRLVTSLGEVPLAALPADTALVREDEALLANEFSLDLFTALLAGHAAEHGREPLPLLPLYVGLTRAPRGGFGAAAALADELRELCEPGTAVVTTGDLVHFGNAYSAPEEMAGLPVAWPELERHFRAEVEAALAAALERRDYEDFHRRSLAALKNDQRNLLPVVAELLGPGAAHEILSFALTDYSGIRGVAPPCAVASALVRYFRSSRQFS